jgi:hypothetical protein
VPVAQQRGVVRAKPVARERVTGDNTARVFFRNGLGLDGQGLADPALKEMKLAGGCQTILREGSSPGAETGFPSSGSAGLGERSE